MLNKYHSGDGSQFTGNRPLCTWELLQEQILKEDM